MAENVLIFHSYFKWAIFLPFFLSFVFLMVSLKNKEFSYIFKTFHKIASITISIQFVIGILVYFTSPLISGALNDMAAAMKDKDLRFYAVEHNLIMFLAVGLFHASQAKIKKEEIPFDKKYKFVLAVYLICIIFIVIGIPWNRPLFK
jgi:hypothetical protein